MLGKGELGSKKYCNKDGEDWRGDNRRLEEVRRGTIRFKVNKGELRTVIEDRLDISKVFVNK